MTGALAAEIDRIRACVGGTPRAAGPDELPRELAALQRVLELTDFERDVVVLCAAAELEPGLVERCRPVTFALALSVLPEPHLSAIGSGAPLRRWRLVEPRVETSLTTAPLRLDERVLEHVLGIRGLDARLDGLVRPLPEAPELAPSQRRTAERAARAWAVAAIQLTGADVSSRRAVATAAAEALDLELFVLDAADVPATAVEREGLARLWEREALLAPRALLVDVEDAGPEARRAGLALAERLRGPLIVSAPEAVPVRARALVELRVRRPGAEERAATLRAALGPAAAAANGALERTAAQFELTWPAVRAVAASLAGDGDGGGAGEQLWTVCREQARTAMEGLAQCVEDRPLWEDLVLPNVQREALRDIARHVRHRDLVHRSWGFAERGERGLGLAALFSGPSGTGKTLAAEVIATDLGLDLYRIDLSSVVSKYIGETEKNLARVFDAAQAAGAVLLFDEADALLGRRTEVRDSHDRYANLEVGYLLQRMEAHRGLAILTTNHPDAIDDAFLRRLRFVIRLPWPGPAERAEIWRRVFPDRTPLEALDIDRLARLNVAGGAIRDIALGAAFRAADAGEPVGMGHVLAAARVEYAKMGRPFTAAETGVRA